MDSEVRATELRMGDQYVKDVIKWDTQHQTVTYIRMDFKGKGNHLFNNNRGNEDTKDPGEVPEKMIERSIKRQEWVTEENLGLEMKRRKSPKKATLKTKKM